MRNLTKELFSKRGTKRISRFDKSPFDYVQVTTRANDDVPYVAISATVDDISISTQYRIKGNTFTHVAIGDSVNGWTHLRDEDLVKPENRKYRDYLDELRKFV